MINKITSFIFLLYVCVLLSVGGFYCSWIQDCLNSVLLVDVNCSGVTMQLVSNLCISWICCTALHNTKCSVHNTLTVKDRSIAVTLHCIHIIHNNRLFPLCALIRVGGFYCTLPVVVDRSWLVYCLSRSCILGRLYWRLLYLYRRTLRICTRGFYGQHLSRVIFLELVSIAHCCFLYARDTTVALEITTSHFVMFWANL